MTDAPVSTRDSAAESQTSNRGSITGLIHRMTHFVSDHGGDLDEDTDKPLRADSGITRLSEGSTRERQGSLARDFKRQHSWLNKALVWAMITDEEEEAREQTTEGGPPATVDSPGNVEANLPKAEGPPTQQQTPSRGLFGVIGDGLDFGVGAVASGLGAVGSVAVSAVSFAPGQPPPAPPAAAPVPAAPVVTEAEHGEEGFSLTSMFSFGGSKRK
jgi:hypothetical protein